MAIYTLVPGTAAYLGIYKNGVEAGPAVFVSHEKGVVVGRFDTPLNKTQLPLKVQAAINKHFGTAFSLEHEKLKTSDTPRARYMNMAVPWTIEVPDELEVECQPTTNEADALPLKTSSS